MQLQFVARENGPERLTAHAEILFDEGPLAGTKLVGSRCGRARRARCT
jgi:hypothetical protein